MSNVDYHWPAGADVDFGGGFMFTPAIGIGFSVAGTAHQDEAELAIRIPHPTFFDAHIADTAETERKLTRAEGSVNLQLVFANHFSERLTAPVFAGPTYFRVQQDVVEGIFYEHDFVLFCASAHRRDHAILDPSNRV